MNSWLRLLGIKIGLSILAAASLASAQSATLSPAKIKQINDVFLRANGLPIEYRAEIQLDAMEAAPSVVRTYLPDLKDLYDALAGVQYQYPYEYAIAFSYTQNKEYWIFSGLLGTKAEALSLRLRLLKVIYAIDPKWAIKEYKALPIVIPRSDCSAVLVPKPDSYITAAPQYLRLKSAASPSDYEWLLDFVGHLPSPVLLSPTATLLSSSNLRGEFIDSLVRQYELMLTTSSATDREAGVIFQKQHLIDNIRTLSKRLVQTQNDPFTLLVALRGFIIRSYAEPSCADSTANWRSVQSSFNWLVVDLKLDGRIKPISDSDFGTRTTASPSSARATPMPDQSQVDKIIGEFFAQRVPDTSFLSKALSTVGISSGNNRLQEVTESLVAQSNSIDPVRYECPECAAFYKTQILLQGSDLAPPSPQKDMLMRLAVDSLAVNENQQRFPVLWLPLAELLLNQTRPVTPEIKNKLRQIQSTSEYFPFGPTPSGSDIRREMEASGNAILETYLQADGVYYHPFSSPMLNGDK